LVALQRELDADGGVAFPCMRKVIGLVRSGASASQVLTGDDALAIRP
jgi:hypothetical protein